MTTVMALVRRGDSSRVHVARVRGTTTYELFGKPYQTPLPGVRALCGVMLPTGSVIMRPGSVATCPACRHLGSDTAVTDG